MRKFVSTITNIFILQYYFWRMNIIYFSKLIKIYLVAVKNNDMKNWASETFLSFFLLKIYYMYRLWVRIETEQRSYIILFYVRCIVKFVNNKIEGMRENFWGKFSELGEIRMKLNEIEALTSFYWGFSNNWKRVNELNYPINPQLNINSMNGFEILIFHRNSRVSHFFNYQSCLLQKIKNKKVKNGRLKW